jgi:uncharacterized membrane protein YjgN (DUF898 family)
MSKISSEEFMQDGSRALEFRGSAKEYFKIWIVNIFLSIITLGIYSAWAKVRTNRYFYSNTFYKESAFEYTANPINILKGRVLVFIVYILFVLSLEVWLNPVVSISIMIFVILFIPWLINKAIKFKLRNTKYRSISFKHQERVVTYYKFFLLHAILNIFTLFLAFPFTYNRFKKLIIDSSAYGKTNFIYSGESKSIYIRYLKITIWYIALLILPVTIFVTIMGSLSSAGSLSKEEVNQTLSAILISTIIGFYLLFIFVSFFLKAIYEAYMRNYIWSKTTLADTTFSSRLRGFKLARIYMLNLIAIILSLGLLTPWAKVRAVRYKCENFLIASPNLDEFLASSSDDESALGDESGEFLDIDIGI